MGDATAARARKRLHPPRLERARLTQALVGAGVVLFAAPLLVLPVRAFADEWRAPALVPQELGMRGFEVAFSDTVGAAGALSNSLAVALATTALAVLIGWPAARVIGERRPRRSGFVLLALALPLLVPPYALGFGLTEWFIRLDLAGTLPGLVLAHLVLVLPYVVLLLAPGFGPHVTELEEMARALGTPPLRRVALVTVPAVRGTLAAAALVGFLVSWSQYGSSLAIGAGVEMLPLVVLPFVQTDPQVAAALTLLFLAPALVALLAAARTARAPI